jgi:5,10-methylenetetrahydromethanopterin reductase
MRFGIALQSNKTPAEYVAQATAIDRHGFDVVSVYNDLFFQPALGPLLLMAPHLHTAQLGPAALSPYTVHPLEIAGQIAVLDLVTQGRAYLGLARGSRHDHLGIVQPRPIQTVRECVLLVRHLLGKETGGFGGQIFRLSPGQVLRYAVVRDAVPITIGTWGPKMARLAGELADEVKIGGSANPAMAASLRQSIAAGEVAAGRPPGSVGLCLGAVTVVDTDRARARAAARREVAMYVPVVAPLDPSLRDAEWLARITVPAERGDLQAVADLIPDAVLDRLAFAGSPADLVRQVEDLASAGVTRVEFGTPHGLDALEGIRLLGEQVLPSFRT